MTHLVRPALLLCIGALVLVPLVPAFAAAHANNNHGTIKVHDDASVDPPRQNNPHVSCEWWIEGFNMAGDSGHLEFYRVPPTSNPSVLFHETNWTGTAETDGDGYHFLAGPFIFPSGHYRVEAYLDQGHPGNREHFAKAKVFWVNPCPDTPVPPPPCPANVTAVAEGDGDVTLSWDAVAGAHEYRIYRAEPGDDFQAIDAVYGTTTYTDADTVVGTTYRYVVTAVVAGAESEGCEEVEATAVPFFPGALAGAAALAFALGAFVVMRRKA